MATNETEMRLQAARAARGVLDGTVLFSQFDHDFGDSDDLLIARVVDLLTHEPELGGLFGANESRWEAHHRQTLDAIEALEKQ